MWVLQSMTHLFLKEFCDGRFRICCSAWPFSHALSIADFVLGSGSRKLVLSDTCIPAFSPVPNNSHHGKEGDEGSCRGSQEGDEGKEGIDRECSHGLFQFLTTCTFTRACVPVICTWIASGAMARIDPKSDDGIGCIWHYVRHYLTGLKHMFDHC